MTFNKPEHPFAARFVETETNLLLELVNTTNETLRRVEILTVFLKDEETPGGPSRINIKFEPLKTIQPAEKVLLSHKTWIDGKPVALNQDKLERLQEVAGARPPYVLDISWEDTDGKSQYQRIPVGH